MKVEQASEQVHQRGRPCSTWRHVGGNAGMADDKRAFSISAFGRAIQPLSIAVLISFFLPVACSSNTGTDGSDAGQDEQDAGGDGGSNDSPYVPPEYEPIEGADFEWIWVDVPGAICRDGSPTGFGVNKNSASKKVMIFYEAGGACYNTMTCNVNPAIANGVFYLRKQEGVFNRDREENPVKDWNFVYFPYCSGDVFAGDIDADPGIGVQKFHGYRNVGLFFDRVAAAFPDLTELLVSGRSAGAIGVGVTAQLISDKFSPDTRVSVISDSCPPMDAQFVPRCLQKQWRDLWAFDQTFLADCGSHCPEYDNYMIDIVAHLLMKFEDKDTTVGIFTAVEDVRIRFFYGFGNNDCNPESDLVDMPPETFSAGVMDMRDRLKKFPQLGTYFAPGEEHGYLDTDVGFYGVTVDGVSVLEWTRDILEGNAYHVGP